MTKLSIGLLAAVALALATAPADAAKKKSKAKKGKAEVAKVEAHPMGFTCTLNWMVGAKQPAACGGK